MTPEIITYDGYLTYRRLTDEQMAAAQQVAADSGESLDVQPDWLELTYSGRDTNRRLVRLLRRLAPIIGDAEGEVVCEIDVEETTPALEFYSIRGGKLLRQRGHVVREPAEEVSLDEAPAEAGSKQRLPA